jgi:hypothetical protein
MNSRMNEDLAWLRVQDVQREVENRRLMAGPSSSSSAMAIANLVHRAMRALRASALRGTGTEPAAPPAKESPHHA